MLKRGVLITLFTLLSTFAYALTGDFDNNLCVNLDDFFLFVEQFDKQVTKDNDEFDLDKNKKIDVEDFFIFAEDWDKCEEKTKENIFEVPLGKAFSQKFKDKFGFLTIGTDLESENPHLLKVETSLTSSEQDYKTDVVMEVAKSAIKYYLNPHKSIDYSLFGSNLRIVSILDNKKMVVDRGTGRDIVVKDGDAFFDENPKNPNWVWDLDDLKTENPIIGVRNDFIWNDNSDNPAKIGECISLPRDYSKICLDSLTVKDEEYNTYKIEYEPNSDLSDADSKLTSVKTIRISTASSNTMKLYSNVFARDIWILGDGMVYYKSIDNQTKFLGNVNSIISGRLASINEDISLIIVKRDRFIDVNVNADNLKETVTASFGVINNQVNSLGLTQALEEANELKWDFGGDTLFIGVKDKDLRASYGTIIRDPKAHGSDDEVVLEIPKRQVKALVRIDLEAAEDEIHLDKDINFISPKNNEIITADAITLNIISKEKSECGYRLFKEVASKLAASGNRFEKSDGFTHISYIKNLEDGNYKVEVQCENEKDEIKKRSISFVVRLKGINAEISIATTKDEYFGDQRIELTDPPSEELNSFERITANVIEDSDNLQPDNHDIEEEIKDVYIVEFWEDSLIRKRLKFERERGIDEKRREIVELRKRGKSALAKLATLEWNEFRVNQDLENEKENINDIQKKFRGDFSQLSFPQDVATKPVLDSNIVYEYSKIFSGVAIKSDESVVNKLTELPYIKQIRKARIYELHLDNSIGVIGADQVWKSSDSNNLPVTGKNVKVAVIDTGVDYTHPDLGGCTTDQFLNGKCEKVVYGVDLGVKGIVDKDPMDNNGHGTHVAATIAGDGKLKGVAPGAKIYAYKVELSDTAIFAAWESISDLDGDGIPFEGREDRVDVVSMSFGTTFAGNPDDEFSQRVDDLVDGGIVAVVSAGNSGPAEGTVSSPGTSRNAITVGASYKTNYNSFEWKCNPGSYTRCGECDSSGKVLCDYWGDGNPKQDQVVVFSSRGPVRGGVVKPDIVAPGAVICAARYDAIFEKGKHPYYYPCIDEKHLQLAGTSMAAPMVSGAVALLLQKNPDWTPLEIKHALKSTAVDLKYGADVQGAGRLDINKAIALEEIPPIISSINIDKDGKASIFGTVRSKNLKRYEILIKGGKSDKWIKAYGGNNQVINGLIGSFDTKQYASGKYDIEIKVYDLADRIIISTASSFVIPHVFISDIVEDKGIDVDNNGFYENLIIIGNINSKENNTAVILNFLLVERGKGRSKYPIISGRLEGEEHTEGEYGRIFILKKGENKLSWTFNGGDIRKRLAHLEEFKNDEKLNLILEVEVYLPYVTGFDAREKKLIPLTKSYTIDSFDKVVDLEASDLLIGRKAFLDSKNSIRGRIKNNGNVPVKGRASVYEIKSKDNDTKLDLIYSAQIFEERFSNLHEFDFDYIPDKIGLHKLRFIVEAEGDINGNNDMKDVEIFVYPKKADIIGWLADYSDKLFVYNETNEVSVEVTNIGKANSKNINVSLFFINPNKAKDKSLIEKRSVDLDIDERKEMDFKWTPQIKGNVILRLEIEVDEDIDLENNIRERNFVVVTNAPDININYINVKNRLRVNEEAKIPIFIENIGPKDAVNVSLIVSGESDGKVFEINRSYIEKIRGGSIVEHVIKWTPEKIGGYKIKVLAEAEGDENLDNNKRENFVQVLPDAPDVTGFYKWNENKPIVNQPYNLTFGVLNRGFKTAEKINVSLFEDMKKDKLIESIVIGSLSPDEEIRFSFAWTPENLGWVNLKFIVEAENDANLDDNVYEFGLMVLNDKPDVRIQYFSKDNFVVNKDNMIEFNIGNEGGKKSDEVFVSLYSVDEISGEETLLVNKSVGILDIGTDTYSRFNYVLKEIGIKKFRLKAIVKNDYDLSNNEQDFLTKITPQSRLTNLGKDALYGHLFLELQKENQGKWESYIVLIDDQKNDILRILEKEETLALDKLYNEIKTPVIKDEGKFRVYIALLDENRNVIETINKKRLEASYQFRKINGRSVPVPVPSQPAPIGGNKL